eukprot:TRINITY_DN2785_c0_g1_i1.p1 TRINITY_DN2785_c0_g1~~TRINITY_DN2785_c0_g1_i1.p1  ORF type:complete len:709 (+),score=227.02 TRINITY_DN2785_c0_g1_i1:67-2193(+)
MAAACGLLLGALAAASTNMNGAYVFGNPSRTGTYSTEYTDESFTVYSEKIATQYSQTYWIMQPKIPLPEDVVAKFNNSVIAVTGYEVDQVFRDVDGKETGSVPIYWAYNHHYVAWINGRADMVKLDKPDYSTGHPRYWKAVEREGTRLTTNPKILSPASAFISEGNGGEFRKSYHGYPRGYAQLIESPQVFAFTPMQIDTRNREYNGTGFKAGPLPKVSSAPADAQYSGLIECPCSTRRKREIVRTFALCEGAAQAAANADVCYEGVASVLNATGTVNATGIRADLPRGCSIVPGATASAPATAYFNTAPSGAACPTASAGGVEGTMHNLVRLHVAVNATGVTITATGPADVWFAAGFNAQAMAETPYAILMFPDGSVQERKLGTQSEDHHDPGTQLAAQVLVASNTVAAGLRTVVMTRALAGKTADHFTFTGKPAVLPMINAVGAGATLEYHKVKGPATLTLLGSKPACLCVGKEQGKIDGQAFPMNCNPEPQSDLLQQHNPSCFPDTYRGGLQCCKHGNFLLDADQEVPPGVMEYYMKFKFYYQPYDASYHQDLPRWYFQTENSHTEYDVPACTGEPCVHSITARTIGGLQAAVPADVQKASKGYKFIYCGGHCHTPSCLSLELYNGETGNLICRQEPVFGKGTGDRFEEPGYVALPPCLWGDEPGLLPPPVLSWDTPVMSIKRNNNTVGHTGEMASWQCRIAVVY